MFGKMNSKSFAMPQLPYDGTSKRIKIISGKVGWRKVVRFFHESSTTWNSNI